MRSPYEGLVTDTGMRMQAGVPTRPVQSVMNPNGLMFRGVVTATYVSDSPGHPQEGREGESDFPTAVYCDVMVYSSLPGRRWFSLSKVLVSQPTGGMHRGRIWKPRATTMNITQDPVDQIANPSYLDGDHVLVGFLNNSFEQPIILRGLPHPAVDTNHEDKELGRRMKLKFVDGDPDFVKHHGAYYGISDIGIFVVDTTFANDGELDETGGEAAPPTDGKGSVNYRLPQDATFDMVLYDMSNPDSPVEVARLNFQKNQNLIDIKDAAGKFHVKVENGEAVTVAGKDAAATLTLGDGAKAVALAEYVEAWCTSHVHPDGMGGTAASLDLWDPKANSDKLTVPDTG